MLYIYIHFFQFFYSQLHFNEIETFGFEFKSINMIQFFWGTNLNKLNVPKNKVLFFCENHKHIQIKYEYKVYIQPNLFCRLCS